MLPIGLGDITGGRAHRQRERGCAIPAVRQWRLREIRPLRDGVQRLGGDTCRGSPLQPKHNLAVAGELEPAAVRDEPMLLGRVLHDGPRVLAENSFRGCGIADHERHSGRHGRRLGRNHAHRPRAVGQLFLGRQRIRGARDANRKATGFGVQCTLTYLGQRAATGEKSGSQVERRMHATVHNDVAVTGTLEQHGSRLGKLGTTSAAEESGDAEAGHHQNRDHDAADGHAVDASPRVGDRLVRADHQAGDLTASLVCVGLELVPCACHRLQAPSLRYWIRRFTLTVHLVVSRCTPEGG